MVEEVLELTLELDLVLEFGEEERVLHRVELEVDRVGGVGNQIVFVVWGQEPLPPQ